ncbi:unnamed protein product [Oppiella nova]|uniref:Carboxylesterase type B domain-containing protein n=1 Tax=Oppiella nova TaxID=334625 RepID=A0A7R9LUX6_9ACAR|nr:unnamed protein product [Oppiella nova]CAG2166480.1 unnamed protein product [Oppiella nova]
MIECEDSITRLLNKAGPPPPPTPTPFLAREDGSKRDWNISKCVCDESNSVVVNTSSGGVRGQTLNVVNHKINQFLNIPYAEPPVGPLRFSPPQPLQTPKQII